MVEENRVGNFFGFYDIFEGFRSLKTEIKVQEHMGLLYKKIYLSFGSGIKILMAFNFVLAFSYYILKYQNNFILNSLIFGVLIMFGLCVVKQTMRKIIRGRYNI